MQLLKKSITQIEIQDQRRKQIDGGVKIAQRVDALRETLASLEAQHEKFISGMQNDLEEKTKPLFVKLESLRRDVAELEEKRMDLLNVPDSEWMRVRKLEFEAKTLQTSLEERVAGINERERKNIGIGVELKTRMFKVKTQERELAKAIAEAAENLYLTSEAKSEAVIVRDGVNEYANRLYQDLGEREARVATQERENAMAKAKNDDIEKDFARREKLLADRYQTLQRNISRAKIK